MVIVSYFFQNSTGVSYKGVSYKLILLVFQDHVILAPSSSYGIILPWQFHKLLFSFLTEGSCSLDSLQFCALVLRRVYNFSAWPGRHLESCNTHDSLDPLRYWLKVSLHELKFSCKTFQLSHWPNFHFDPAYSNTRFPWNTMRLKTNAHDCT